jgi:hypothetical protein
MHAETVAADAARTPTRRTRKPRLGCPFITPTEGARIAHVDPATIIGWVQAGALKGHKLVGRWRIDPDDLERLLKDANAQGRDPAAKR